MTQRNMLKLFLLFIFISVSVKAQENVLNSYSLLKIKTVLETAVSPDGNYAAYTLLVPRPLTDKPGSDYRYLYLYDFNTNNSKGLLTDKHSIGEISWSPASNRIYFRAKIGDAKTTQVHYIDVSGGSPTAVTSAENGVSQYELSPDGKKIAYISTEGNNAAKKNLEDKGFDAEIYEEEIIDLNLYLKELDSDEAKKLTNNISVFDFKWTPDGSHFVAAVAKRNLVDDSYMFKRIYYIDAEGGAMRKIVENPGKLGDISISPDGKKIAFISGVDINDPVAGSLFTAEIPNEKDFADLQNYTKNFEGSAASVAWLDENTILYSSEEGVNTTLRQVKYNNGESNLIIEPGTVIFTGFDVNGGKIVFAGNTPEHPSELYVSNMNEAPKRLTNNNEWLEDIKLAKQEKIEYEARDGLRIEAVLLYPLNFEEGTAYPMITYIHGGPEAAVHNGWSTSYSMWGQIAASKDYFVFMPNYRASSGRGVEYSKMDFGKLGAEEFDDVLDGISFLTEKGWVDKKKVGIGGGSYGGYFAAWGATKHTEHFAAAVMFVGISNQISKRNTTDIPYEDYYVHWGFWTHEDYEKVYDASPVKYAHQSKTPTLILHGKEDPRVHPSQSLEMYRSLKLHGKAPVRLVWYPGQGHGNSKNTSRLDYSLRTMEWFDYYLKSNKPKDRMPDKYLEVEIE